MDDCIHGFFEGLCGDCATVDERTTRSIGGGAGAEYAFALIYAPSFRSDSFVHLNRQGARWKIRDYSSPNRSADVLAQSAPSSDPRISDVDAIERRLEIFYPHSKAPGGVPVDNTQYWFDEIARANAQHADAIPALR